TEKLLTKWGCEVVIAENLEQAIERILKENFKPEVILADFRLRDQANGLDAIDAIREEFNQEIPAILITGDTAPERLQTAKNANVAIMYKPVEPDELALKLEAILSIAHQVTD
ncbi:MAG: response regulator, partial [Arenicellales bacterium]